MEECIHMETFQRAGVVAVEVITTDLALGRDGLGFDGVGAGTQGGALVVARR